MVRRTAGNDENLVHAVQERLVPCKLLQNHRTLILLDTRRERCTDCFRLFVDFLQHEMLETALFRRLRIPVDLKDFFTDRYSRIIHDGNADLGDHRHLAVAQDISTPRMRDNRRNIRRDEVFTFSKPDDKRIVLL